ncbi:MAG: hypothetical protein KAH18_12935 [Psychromonas sp.]|nr:hypothetical protein [Psychromonas sp.]
MPIKDCIEILSGLTFNPERFLQTNILFIPSPEQRPNNNAVHRFDFIKSSGNLVHNIYCGSFSATGAITAYYLPWSVNTGHYVLLENRADLMFTAKLSGCGVGYSVYPTGTVKVSHHNIYNFSNRCVDEAALEKTLFFAGEHAFQPKDYWANGKGRATIIGIADKMIRSSLISIPSTVAKDQGLNNDNFVNNFGGIDLAGNVVKTGLYTNSQASKPWSIFAQNFRRNIQGNVIAEIESVVIL